jgi:hypothetical protein
MADTRQAKQQTLHLIAVEERLVGPGRRRAAVDGQLDEECLDFGVAHRDRMALVVQAAYDLLFWMAG